MGRVLAIDYGLKRTGLAVTDPMKLIASPLETIGTSTLIEWLKEYVGKEDIESIVVGLPTKQDGTDTNTTTPVYKLIDQLNETFPKLTIYAEDERFTTKMAKQVLLESGMKKKQRRNKALLDKISAALILQSFLQRST